MIADPPIYAPWLLFAICVIFVAYVFWDRDDAPDNSTDGSASTSGSNSPAFSGPIHGPVTINNGIMAEPAKPERPYKYDIDKLNEGLSRAFARLDSGSQINPLSATPPGLARYVKADRCPDYAAWQALAHIAQVIGDDAATHFAKSRTQLRQAALDGRVQIWGRQGISPAHMKAPLTCSEVWTKIPADYWRDYRLNNNAAVDASDALDHTDAEQHVSHDILANKYWTLRVDKQAVEQNWRLPKEPSPSSPPHRDLGPNGWMAR
ncbi:MAG: hypothetical protein JHC57_04590 [Sphingopyxis sp.]|uniref:hypothetical protein n=1 Tax=Sphingopyxis sp. TaxID=1908224 RepID=UPI001A188C68|nr:hypothetical protein [Sphingopyxis sp.]MBJ7499015.1 hypothetical protein [Sphingopyxis sp.]